MQLYLALKCGTPFLVCRAPNVSHLFCFLSAPASSTFPSQATDLCSEECKLIQLSLVIQQDYSFLVAFNEWFRGIT